jgi:tRNA nucleotidyltransferase (CCA-adding enzyme)
MADCTVQLDHNEQQLCSLLLDFTRHLQSTRPDVAPVTMRIAGGWVRDKLLRHASHDIDIALDTMMGYDFAQLLHAYVFDELKQPALFGHHGNVARIKSNPEKSKHLETATVRVCNLEIDFVNLRKEVYEETSRIPTIVCRRRFHP